jgi:hypothetical protein
LVAEVEVEMGFLVHQMVVEAAQVVFVTQQA